MEEDTFSAIVGVGLGRRISLSSVHSVASASSLPIWAVRLRWNIFVLFSSGGEPLQCITGCAIRYNRG